MGFEELGEDKADDNNSSNNDEARDQHNNKMTSDFTTQRDFQNSHIVKILPVRHEKQPFSFLVSLSCFPAVKMAQTGLQVCSEVYLKIFCPKEKCKTNSSSTWILRIENLQLF